MASPAVDLKAQQQAQQHESTLSIALFVAAALAVALAACGLAGFAPLGFSIVTVFLFAGPHNWLEARYMMSRMPARWGKLWFYFTFGIGGVLLLVAWYVVQYWAIGFYGVTAEMYLALIACWNTAFALWLMTLIQLRSRQNPRRNWVWIWPVGLGLIALNWLFPLTWSLVLVYVHPLVALWFLDRELGRCRPGWRTAYRWCLLAVPPLLLVLWFSLANVEELPGEDMITMQIAAMTPPELVSQISNHAGSHILSGLSSRMLVATHTFLEMLHYGAWVLAIPLITLRTAPWSTADVPLAKSSPWWKWGLAGVLVIGGATVLLLWAGFLADYPLTRDVYFTIAMLHVLAEAPFLLRLL